MSWKDLLKRTLKGKKRQMTYAEEQIAGENTVKPNPMVIQVIPQEDPPVGKSFLQIPKREIRK